MFFLPTTTILNEEEASVKDLFLVSIIVRRSWPTRGLSRLRSLAHPSPRSLSSSVVPTRQALARAARVWRPIPRPSLPGRRTAPAGGVPRTCPGQRGQHPNGNADSALERPWSRRARASRTGQRGRARARRGGSAVRSPPSPHRPRLGFLGQASSRNLHCSCFSLGGSHSLSSNRRSFLTKDLPSKNRHAACFQARSPNPRHHTHQRHVAM